MQVFQLKNNVTYNIPGYFCRIANNVHSFRSYSGKHLVVFTTPSPESVAVAVNFLELVARESRHTTCPVEQIRILQFVCLFNENLDTGGGLISANFDVSRRAFESTVQRKKTAASTKKMQTRIHCTTRIFYSISGIRQKH